MEQQHDYQCATKINEIGEPLESPWETLEKYCPGGVKAHLFPGV